MYYLNCFLLPTSSLQLVHEIINKNIKNRLFRFYVEKYAAESSYRFNYFQWCYRLGVKDFRVFCDVLWILLLINTLGLYIDPFE